MSVSSKKYVWGVKIYEAESGSLTDADIGLYGDTDVITNGAFATDTAWTKYVFGDGAITINGQLTLSAPTGIAYVYQSMTTVVGKVYGIRVTLSGTGVNSIRIGTTAVGYDILNEQSLTNGLKIYYFTAVGTTTWIALINEGLGVSVWDNLSVCGTGQFRWSQYAVTATDTWKAGIINEDGIGEIGQAADFSIGGNSVKVKGTSVSVTNIIGTTPFWKKLVDAGISLAGCKCEIIEFDTSVEPATETVLFHGTIESAPVWDIASYRISISEPYYKRDTMIGKLVNTSDFPNAPDSSIGELFPIVFGSDQNVKIKTTYQSQKIYSGDIPLISTGMSDEEKQNDQFSFVSYTFSTKPIIKICIIETHVYDTGTLDAYLESFFLNKYIEIDGAQTRKITELVSSVDANGTYVSLTLNAWLTAAPSAGTFVKIYSLPYNVYFETWPTIGVLKGLVTHSENVFYLLNNINYLAIATVGLTINPVYSQNGIDAFQSFIIYPFTAEIQNRSVNPMTGHSNMYVISGHAGVYFDTAHNAYTDTYAGDALAGFSEKWHGTHSGAEIIRGFCFEILKPMIPENIKVSGISLMLDDLLTIGDDLPGINAGTFSIKITPKYFLGTGTEKTIKTWTIADFTVTAMHLQVENSDTNYYEKLLNNNALKGYTATLLTGISSIDEYKRLKSIILSYYLDFQNISLIQPDYGVTYTYTKNSYSLLILTDIDYADVYANISGRIFNSTWAGGRTGREKTAANLMESPIDILEHVNRLQNWTEEGATEEPGNEYAASASINTATTEGGFDSGELDTIRGFKSARQILDEGDARSGRIKESLCKQYFLCSYTNMSGQECVNTIHKRTATPDVNITLAHTLPDSLSEFEEVDVSNIFCQPFVRYAYNGATDKYDGIIRVTNAHKATFDAVYVSGYTGPDAELVWDLCHALYGQYRVVTEPPEEMTDCKWIRTETDAKAYLVMWLEWMGAYTTDGSTVSVSHKRRFTFDVAYSVAMTIGTTHAPWFPSMRFNITLPHQTNNATLQCIVEEISFDVNNNKATCTAICYDITNDIQYFVKDTYKTHAEGTVEEDWKDTVSTKAETPTNENDVKDSM